MSLITDDKEREETLETLKTLGLSTKESLVYLSLMTLGEMGTTAISLDTKLHRQFVYDTLASLEDKGLIGHSIVRGRKKFFSYSASRLSTIFDYKKKLADEFATKIEKRLLPSDIQQFEVYRGQEAFVTNELSIINSARPGSKIYVFGGVGDEYTETLGKYFTEYEYQRKKKGIEVLYLGAAVQAKFLTETRDSRDLFTYRLLPSSLTGELCITTYEDRICFYMFGSPVANFTVKSEKIAKSYIDFFMGLWQISK